MWNLFTKLLSIIAQVKICDALAAMTEKCRNQLRSGFIYSLDWEDLWHYWNFIPYWNIVSREQREMLSTVSYHRYGFKITEELTTS